MMEGGMRRPAVALVGVRKWYVGELGKVRRDVPKVACKSPKDRLGGSVAFSQLAPLRSLFFFFFS